MHRSAKDPDVYFLKFPLDVWIESRASNGCTTRAVTVRERRRNIRWFLLWETFIQNWWGGTHVYVAEVNDWRQTPSQSCLNTMLGRWQLPTTAARENDCSITQPKWRQFCVEDGGLLEIIFLGDESYFCRLSVSDWFWISESMFML